MSRKPNLPGKMVTGMTPTRFKPWPLALFLIAMAMLSSPGAAWASAEGGSGGLISAIGISIMAATALAFLAYLTKQPLLLAYLAAGAVIGPQFGFGWVSSQADIKIITEIGLILLLFMIGLELNLNKLRESGESLLATGIFQFILCAAMGFGFFLLLGFTIGEPFEYRIFGVKVLGGQYDLLYLAVCLALSSTTIVVKLLYEKFELGTLAGRLTLGVLVFQDIWAIVLLSIQTSLSDPKILSILIQFGQAALLIAISMTLSKYVLGYLFRKIARLPELMLVASLGWCFLICALAGLFNLSLEMGALIAGVAISTFPYNLDIISKIVNIRDFFITLFFVALGMEIPNPMDNLGIFLVAGAASLFLVASRFLSVYPILYFLKNGNRVSLLTSINLSQASEFALVITAIGLKSQHIVSDIQAIIIFVFVITSISSTYMIKYSQQLQGFLSKIVERVGFKDLESAPADEPAATQPLMYQKIASHPTVREIWAHTLVGRGAVASEAAEAMIKARTAERIAECWAMMDAQVSPGRYIIGDGLSVLDLYVTVMSRWTPRRRRFYAVAPKMAEVVKRVDADPRLAAFWAERMPFEDGWEG